MTFIKNFFSLIHFLDIEPDKSSQEIQRAKKKFDRINSDELAAMSLQKYARYVKQTKRKRASFLSE